MLLSETYIKLNHYTGFLTWQLKTKDTTLGSACAIMSSGTVLGELWWPQLFRSSSAGLPTCSACQVISLRVVSGFPGMHAAQRSVLQ